MGAAEVIERGEIFGIRRVALHSLDVLFRPFQIQNKYWFTVFLLDLLALHEALLLYFLDTIKNRFHGLRYLYSLIEVLVLHN